MKVIYLLHESLEEYGPYYVIGAFTRRADAAKVLEKYNKRAMSLPTPITEDQWADMEDNIFNKYCETNDDTEYDIDDINLSDYYALFPDYSSQDIDNAYYNYVKLPIIRGETHIITEVDLAESDEDVQQTLKEIDSYD